jgi:hypothetical protein
MRGSSSGAGRSHPIGSSITMADLSPAALSLGLGSTPETDEERRRRLLQQQQQRLVPGMSGSYAGALSPAGMSLGLGQT